jgi:hypothetical protein
MKDKLLARGMGFRNDDDIYEVDDLVVQITDVTDRGNVEIAFDEPKSNRRHYVRFTLAELLSLVMIQPRSKEED